MSKNKAKDFVKVPSTTVEFSDTKINVFVNELIKTKHFEDAFKLIFSKAYYNLDFFLDDTTPVDSKITIQQNSTHDSDMHSKIDSLSEFLIILNEQQEVQNKALIDSTNRTTKLVETIDDLVNKNAELVSTLTEIQSSMKNTEEGLKVLNKIEKSGIRLDAVIENNTISTTTVNPIKEATKSVQSSDTNKIKSESENKNVDKKEISSAISGGLFSNINFGNSQGASEEDKPDTGGGLDIAAIMARMRGGN